MRHLRRRFRPVAAAAALSLALAACGTAASSDGTTEARTEAGQTETAGSDTEVLGTEAEAPENGDLAAAAGLEGETDSPAAQLQTTLTALLQGHVQPAGIALDTGAGFGFDSQELELAAVRDPHPRTPPCATPPGRPGHLRRARHPRLLLRAPSLHGGHDRGHRLSRSRSVPARSTGTSG